MFEEQVQSPNGNTKTVRADNQQELDEAVAAVKSEMVQIRPDIDNPEHANMRDAEFVADNQPVKEKESAMAEDKPKLEDEQDNPAAEERTAGEVEQTEQTRQEAADKEAEPAQEAPEPAEVAKEEAMPAEESKADEKAPTE